jgi:hypothetical protein
MDTHGPRTLAEQSEAPRVPFFISASMREPDFAAVDWNAE